ncbi:MAG: hypothetical protein Q7S76_03800, partial [bacterium]|nr:hypothetical protein [bacterium]
AKKISRNQLFAAISASLFLLLSGYSEAVYWISASGFLFTASFTLASLLSYISWEEKRRPRYFIASIIFFTLSLLFHELGVVTPFLFLLYHAVFSKRVQIRAFVTDRQYRLLFLPLPLYLLVRTLAQSHWLSGDYNYNLFKLPLNAIGNAIGYFGLVLVGPFSSPVYQIVRNGLREHIVIALGISAIFLVLIVYLHSIIYRILDHDERKIYVFSLLFFFVSLLPFLGLGNMSPRYSYLSSVGVVFLFVLLLKKLFALLSGTGRSVGILSVVLVMSIFVLFQLVQGRQAYSDWHEAGKKAKTFIVAIEGAYQDHWAEEPMEFHLVNVPIRSGDAWVFPVGISDALKLVTRNPNIGVTNWDSVSSALTAVGYTSRNRKIFEFGADNTLTEIKNLRPSP